MILLEKISNTNEQIERASIYVRKVRFNARQVGRDFHRYQQSIAETDFLRDIGNKGFNFPPVNNDE